MLPGLYYSWKNLGAKGSKKKWWCWVFQILFEPFFLLWIFPLRPHYISILYETSWTKGYKWVFPKIMVPQNGMVYDYGNPTKKREIWGYHYFRKHPNKRIATRGSSLQSCWIPTPYLRAGEGQCYQLSSLVVADAQHRTHHGHLRRGTKGVKWQLLGAWWLDHPSDNFSSKWVKIFPNFRGEHKKQCFKPPTR